MLSRILLLSTVALLAACNVSTGDPDGKDATEPTVVSVSPDIDSINQSLDATIEITFSASMDTSTITLERIDITPTIAGSLSFSSNNTKVTFTPDSPLSAGVTYRVDILAGVTDAAGTALPLASFSFTTNSWQGVIQSGAAATQT